MGFKQHTRPDVPAEWTLAAVPYGASLRRCFDQSGQPLQGVTLLVVEGAWPLIDDAEGADQGALRAGNRHAGIEADVGMSGNQWVL